jgi:hypothetical protein
MGGSPSVANRPALRKFSEQIVSAICKYTLPGFKQQLNKKDKNKIAGHITVSPNEKDTQ